MKKLIKIALIICFLATSTSFKALAKEGVPSGHASSLNLPPPTKFISLSNDYSFPVLKGLKFNPANPFSMEFIIDTANKKKISKEEAAKLIRYFLAALTIPEKDIWVNLSPYEKNRITSNDLACRESSKKGQI